MRLVRFRFGDRIATGAGSRALVKLSEGSVVKLGENGTLRLAELQPSRELFKAALQVLQGAFRFTTDIVGKGRRREVNVRVEQVTIGIRGTDVWGRSHPDRQVVLLLGDGAFGFSGMEFDTLARHGVDVGELLIGLRPGGRQGGSWRPLLHHLAKQQPQRRRTVKLPAPRRQPRVLTAGQVQAILDACVHLRDRLLFAVLFDSGMRIGEALGLRHEDLAVAERQVTVTPRTNDNRARVKGGTPRTIPVSAELLRLYADYLHGEYGELDSDYVFVNLWGRPHGRPLAYPAVYDLVGRLRRRTQIRFEPHQFRHTYATWLLRNGAGMDAVKALLGHRSLATTLDTYGHLTVEDARKTLDGAGWFTGREVRL